MSFDAPSYPNYGNRWPDTSTYRGRLRPEAVIDRTVKLLDTNTYDTVVLAGVEWITLGQGVRERLMQRIEAGMGVVLCMDPRQIGQGP